MKLVRWMTVMSLLMPLGPAWAHGEAHPGKARVTGKKEQTPWGVAGDAKAAKRTVTIGMHDTMRFNHDKVLVRQGETVRFVVKNHGKLMHEMVIGTKKALDEHAALMAKLPDMEHEEAHMAHVAPGKDGEIVWTFNRPGEFAFACLIPGHYEAGMRGSIIVSAR